MSTRKARQTAPKAVSTSDPTAKEAPARQLGSAGMIIRAIVEGLYAGRYVPGQRLIEADLTSDFGVSRGSVREALNRLEAEGILKLNLHRGAQIRLLTRKEALDVLAPVELLVGLSARLAAESIDLETNREELRSSVAELMKYENRADALGLIRARNSFYRTLNRIGGNRELGRILPALRVHLLRVQFRNYATEAEEERFEDYRQMANAILAGDARKAELAARRHVRRLAAAIDALPDAAFAREV